MDWSSFGFGLLCGGAVAGLLSGMLGIGIGCSIMGALFDRSEKDSDLMRIIKHAGREIPVGDTISFTMGHDVMFPCGSDDPDDDNDDGDEGEDAPFAPVNGWGRI